MEYENLKTLEDFYSFRGLLNVSNFEELKKCIESGILNLDEIHLGSLLEILRFKEEKTIGLLGSLNKGKQIIVRDDLGDVFNSFGFTLISPSSCFRGISQEELGDLVLTWYKSQDEKKWNPSYAPEHSFADQVIGYCGSHMMKDILMHFELSGYLLELNLETEGLIYPFSGWELAKCLGLGLEG